MYYATLYLVFLLNFLELIETIDENAELALVAAARKELVCLEQFG
jgi:hypothetical protein